MTNQQQVPTIYRPSVLRMAWVLFGGFFIAYCLSAALEMLGLYFYAAAQANPETVAGTNFLATVTPYILWPLALAVPLTVPIFRWLWRRENQAS